MNTDINAITERIIGCAFQVANSLGAGFLEKVYENALAIEFHNRNLSFRQQYPIEIHYNDMVVGDYIADFLINEKVLVELKAIQSLNKIHEAQCLNYLRGARLSVCLLINFGTPKNRDQKTRSLEACHPCLSVFICGSIN